MSARFPLSPSSAWIATSSRPAAAAAAQKQPVWGIGLEPEAKGGAGSGAADGAALTEAQQEALMLRRQLTAAHERCVRVRSDKKAPK